MATLNGCKFLCFDNRFVISRNDFRIEHSTAPIHYAQLFRTDYALSYKPITLTRSKIHSQRYEVLKQSSRVRSVSCLSEDSYESCPDTEQSVSDHSKQEASFDLKIPRRSLLVTFTCNVCGVRSQRLINRLAYERGLVYVQCSGCSKYHRLVDNLGLVIEYNLQLQDEIDLDTNAEQV